jgi:hypothetical protein
MQYRAPLLDAEVVTPADDLAVMHETEPIGIPPSRIPCRAFSIAAARNESSMGIIVV